MWGYSLVPAETHHSRLTRSLYLRSSFGCCPFVVRSLSVCCPFVVRSIDEQQAYDNQTSFALQSDMHRGCTLGKISILVQSFWENGIYVSRGRMFSMDIEGIIKRGRKGDKKALGCLYRAYHRQMTGICQDIVGNRQTAEEVASKEGMRASSTPREARRQTVAQSRTGHDDGGSSRCGCRPSAGYAKRIRHADG